MLTEVKVIQDIHMITLKNAINQDNYRRFESIVFQLFTKKIEKLIIDLSGLNYIDSAGIGVLINCRKTLIKNRGTLILIITNPTILKIFSVTKLDLLFKIMPHQQEAIDFFMVKSEKTTGF